ncbi:MAG: hypothetical protein AAGC45_00520 [Bacteroidota bacterium]
MKHQRGKSIVFIVLFAGLLLCSFVLKQSERIILAAFESKIVLINNTSPFQISYKGIDISILRQSFQLKQVLILPDSLSNSDKRAQPHISINSVVANDFELIPLLFNRHLKIGQINFRDLDMVYRKRKNGNQTQRTSFDATKVKKNRLKELTIENIFVNHYNIAHLGTNLLDSTAIITGEILLIGNVTLKRTPGKEQLALHPSLLNLSGSNLTGKFADTELKLSNFKFDSKSTHALLEGLQMGNPDSSWEKARRQKYNIPVNSLRIMAMECFGIQTDSLFQRRYFRADSILVDRAQFTIVKNIEKPWNTSKTIPLPHQLLRSKGQHISIQKIRIEDAKTRYIEITHNDEIEIPIDQLQLSIENLGQELRTLKGQQVKPMEINMQGRLFNDFPINMSLTFQNPLQNNQFSFEGSTGPFYFESFNPVMVPTSNIKFESGHVRSINFNGTGNAEKTSGELVMLYENLSATVLKQNGQKKNTTFSWLANAAVRKENPKNGRLKVAKMGYGRIPYKGFGNYMFKTIESGLINSVYPFGKRKEYKR